MTFKHKVGVFASPLKLNSKEILRKKKKRFKACFTITLIYKNKTQKTNLLALSYSYQPVHGKGTVGECLCSIKADGL